ncbi:MAG: 2-hydroxy-3-oxopropionate reductase [Burkholderia sp.]|jgi:3-hydroxyisobutyrate dehydrogenase-like beta-hydroxyacid dehydrogenase|nr:2-hydroxy-3-oxopropionate reductase [Burkholderia sp.]
MCRNLLQQLGLKVYVADINVEYITRLAARGAIASPINGLREMAGSIFQSLSIIDHFGNVCFGHHPLLTMDDSISTVGDMSTSDVVLTQASSKCNVDQGSSCQGYRSATLHQA